jgi:ligand-binding sensor domain-containing protein/signal transduction histidine kinase
MLCRKIPLFAAALTWSLAPPLHAQFDHLSLEHGLSQTTVLCILQDSKGYLWFGTADGLNKYDGYGFTVYRNNPRKPHSLSDDWATAICEDQFGSLWIGTSKGVLNRFDRKNERFTRYNFCAPSTLLSPKAKTPVELPFIFSFFIDQTITTIFTDTRGSGNTLWVGTVNCGLYRLALDSAAAASRFGEGLQTQENNNNLKIDNTIFQVTHYQHDPANPHSVSDNHVRAIHRDRAGRLWIGTLGGGLNRLDEATGKFIHYKHDPADANSLSNDRVLAIYEDSASRNALWIGTLGGGLNKLVAAANSGRNETAIRPRAHFEHYRHDPSNPHSLSDDDVSAIIEDDYRTLWVGTFGGGLNRFDRAAKRFTHFKHDRFNPHSLGDNDVLAIGADRTGILWIGSQLGVGINKLDRRKEKFVHYKSDPTNPRSLSDDVVWSISSPARGDGSVVWIGTYRGGLNRLDRKTPTGAAGPLAYFRHDPSDPHSLCQNHIRSICEDASGALWVGTYSEGICKLLPQAIDEPEKQKVKFIHYRHDANIPHSLSDDRIRSIHRGKSGTLWIGTFGGGLNKFDEITGRFIHYRHDPAKPRSLSDDHVYTIYEDRSGTLWIGTFGGGLNRLVLDKKSGPHGNEAGFVSFKHDPADSSSLSDNRVLSICEDKHGALWIGTSGGGLNRFDRESGKFTHFTTQNDLASNVIYGILEDERGNLWLSSNNGLSRFNPRTQTCKNYDERDGLQSKEFSGGAYCQATSGEMFFGGINGVNCFFPDSLKDNFYVPPIVISAFKKFDETVSGEPEKIELSHHENFFSIEFAALDYANPAKNQYAYKLEGFDQAWIYGGMRRSAGYTNLNPGKYIFRAKGTNSDGVWNERGAALQIIIYPPFWKTWWFRFAAAGALILLLMLAHDYRVKQKLARLMEIEQARKAENELLRKQVADDFHDEFGQKLTNIALFAELGKRNLNNASPRAMAHLGKISDAAKSLSEAMRDFIWTLDRNKDSLYNVAERLKDYGEALFSKTGIDFEVRGLSEELEQISLSMDWKRHLIQIFKAGMQNSLRHDGCKNVVLGIGKNGQSLEIYLADDSKGFGNDDDAAGPAWRYMKKRAEKIRGRLNVFAGPDRGTRIQFTGSMP